MRGFVRRTLLLGGCQDGGDTLPEFSAAQVAKKSWSLGKSQLLDAIGDRGSTTLPDFPGPDLCSIAWDVAKLEYEDADLMRASSETAVTAVSMLSPMDVAGLSWALAE